MKRIHPEDPRVTAYALGELPEHEAGELRRAAEEDPAVQAALNETHALAELIGSGFKGESHELGEARREAIRRAGRRPAPENVVSMQPSRRDWVRPAAVSAAAAALVACVLWMLQQIPASESKFVQQINVAEQREDVRMQILLGPTPQPYRTSMGGVTPLPKAPRGFPMESFPDVPPAVVDEEYLALRELFQNDPEAFMGKVRDAARAAKLPILSRIPFRPDNPFIPTREDAHTTVPIVSGTASYHLVERFVRNEKKLPPKNSVRTEELINQVSYQDEGDADLDGIKLGVEIVRCPWDRETILMGVLLRNGSKKVISQEAVLQIEVKQKFIKSYRLIGYAGTKEPKDEKPAVSPGLAPGKSNFVLYQLLPIDSEVFSLHRVVARVGLNLGEEDGRGLIVPVTSPPRDWELASNNLQTAVALGSWGMLLRASPFGGALSHTDVRKLAEDALNRSDESDLRRREALRLILDSLLYFEIDPEVHEK